MTDDSADIYCRKEMWLVSDMGRSGVLAGRNQREVHAKTVSAWGRPIDRIRRLTVIVWGTQLAVDGRRIRGRTPDPITV